MLSICRGLMEDNDGRKCELEMDGLSLIDVSSEDDCLLFSSSLDPGFSFSETGMDDNVLGLLDSVPDHNEEIPVSSLHDEVQVLQPHESPVPEKMKKVWKYNLRKSLAWDKAFFTSAGVLEPEELSNIIESNQKGEKQVLSTIQEDVHRSTESISTLQSDCTTGDSHERVLSEDIRASMQRFCNTSNAAAQNASDKSGETETTTTTSSSKMDGISRNKMKPKASPKKTIIRAKGSGKTVKQVSLCLPVSQSVSTRGGLSVSKLPKSVGRVVPMSTPSTKRVSLVVNRAKLEQDAKSVKAVGKDAPITKGPVLVSRTRNIPPKPLPPSKSSMHSSAAIKNQLTSSCSSLESCVSASSGSSHKSYLNSVKKNDSGSTTANPSSFTGRSTSSVASRSTSQPRNPHLSTHLMSKAKLSSSASPDSSFSDLSSESSAVSRSNQRSTSPKACQKTTSCLRSPAKDDTARTLNSQNAYKHQFSDGQATESAGEGLKRVSTGNDKVVHPASMKPTGLRMPSPKIGFFDGMRTAARTPTGNVQTPRGVMGVLPRHGVHSPSASSSSANSGKCQSSRSRLQDSSNSKPKANSVSRTSTNLSFSSPKFQKKNSPKTSRVKQGKVVVDEKTKGSVKKSYPAYTKDPNTNLDNERPDTSIDRNSASGDKVVERQGNKSRKKAEAVDTDMRMGAAKEGSGDDLSLVSERKGMEQAVVNVNNSPRDEDGTLGVSSGPEGCN